MESETNSLINKSAELQIRVARVAPPASWKPITFQYLIGKCQPIFGGSLLCKYTIAHHVQKSARLAGYTSISVFIDSLWLHHKHWWSHFEADAHSADLLISHYSIFVYIYSRYSCKTIRDYNINGTQYGMPTIYIHLCAKIV